MAVQSSAAGLSGVMAGRTGPPERDNPRRYPGADVQSSHLMVNAQAMRDVGPDRTGNAGFASGGHQRFSAWLHSCSNTMTPRKVRGLSSVSARLRLAGRAVAGDIFGNQSADRHDQGVALQEAAHLMVCGELDNRHPRPRVSMRVRVPPHHQPSHQRRRGGTRERRQRSQ